MSKHEIIQAYIRGELDRRGFVTRLATLGVSAGAAAAYATQFAPGISAAAPGGFVVRAAQTTDADYGTTVDFASDAEAVAFASDIANPIADIYNSLDSFEASDFDDGVFAQLTDFSSEIGEQNDALKSLSATRPTTNATMGLKRSTDTDPSQFLADLSSAYDLAVQRFTAVVPAVDSGEIRQTLANISHAVARHAGVLAFLVKGDGTPDGAFEKASK
ncbi:MAG: hypothetical protein QM589_04170 [Thermomicrobiales bacterium]